MINYHYHYFQVLFVVKLLIYLNDPHITITYDIEKNAENRIAVVDVAVFDQATEQQQLRESLEVVENDYQYCARHGYDYIRSREAYPLFGSHVRSTAITNYELVRTTLPFYGWVYMKQNDVLFMNMDISIEETVRHVPDDKHLVFTAGSPFVFCDIAILFRNSPRYSIR